MLSRRGFVGMASALVGTGAVAGTGARVAPVAAIRRPTFYKAIYDVRFPTSVAFAARARTLGLAVAPIVGDVTDLWYHDLYRCWRDHRSAVAGLLTRQSLFCLDLVARDQGLKLAVVIPVAATASDAIVGRVPELVQFVIAPRDRRAPCKGEEALCGLRRA